LARSASFLDRLRGTGRLEPARARDHGALGPIGRASGVDDDGRRQRPYDAYPRLGTPTSATLEDGDALARARVRWLEIDSSARLVDEAAQVLPTASGPHGAAVRVTSGFATGWAEAAQGEALYGLEIADGRVVRCFARSASLHNLMLFGDVFAGDILTDFPFIEASFGLSYAGVAM
jgi:Ni,Fe-hydrogenase III large subunit